MKKDYLHLYLGCQFYSTSTHCVVGTVEGVVGKTIHFRSQGVWYSADATHGYKLLLRPLSDMTEEEAYECITQNPFYAKYQIIDAEYYRDRLCFKVVYDSNSRRWGKSEEPNHPEQFRYLLSKGFDLFGLIEDGLAIDKTTLK